MLASNLWIVLYHIICCILSQYLCMLFWLQCISPVQTFRFLYESLPIKTALLQSRLDPNPFWIQFHPSLLSRRPLLSLSLISSFISSLSPPDQNNRHVRNHQVCVCVCFLLCWYVCRPHKFICVFLCPLVQMLTQHQSSVECSWSLWGSAPCLCSDIPLQLSCWVYYKNELEGGVLNMIWCDMKGWWMCLCSALGCV